MKEFESATTSQLPVWSEDEIKRQPFRPARITTGASRLWKRPVCSHKERGAPVPCEPLTPLAAENCPNGHNLAKSEPKQREIGSFSGTNDALARCYRGRGYFTACAISSSVHPINSIANIMNLANGRAPKEADLFQTDKKFVSENLHRAGDFSNPKRIRILGKLSNGIEPQSSIPATRIGVSIRASGGARRPVIAGARLALRGWFSKFRRTSLSFPLFAVRSQLEQQSETPQATGALRTARHRCRPRNRR